MCRYVNQTLPMYCLVHVVSECKRLFVISKHLAVSAENYFVKAGWKEQYNAQ